MEGLISGFSPDGSVASILPYKNGSFWLRYGYTTLVTTLSLIICLFGSKSFGRTSVVVLALVSVCAIVMFASFATDQSLIVSFTYNTPEIEYCKLPEEGSQF